MSEEVGLGRGQLVVGPGEHGADRRPGVLVPAQRVKGGVLVGEFGDDVGDGDARVGGCAPGSDAQGQRQLGAQADEVIDRDGFRRGAVWADDADDQGRRLGVAQHVDGEPVGCFGDDQAAQAVPAGHQHHAPRGTR